MTLYRLNTSWGDAALRLDGSSVIELTHPGGALARSARDIAEAPAAIRSFATRFALYFDGASEPLVERAELQQWLEIAGVDGFRRDLLLALHEVPYGVTLSYGELAELAGSPRAARAAGTACAGNPLPIIVPCHRVLPASRRLGNYGSLGPDYKRRLLQLEGVTGIRP